MSTSFLTSYTVQIVLDANPLAVERLTRPLPGYERIWTDAMRRDLTTLANRWSGLLSSYYSPDNFLEKAKQGKVHGEFMTRFRELYNMPRKQAPRNFDRVEWKGFLERRLTDAELEAFDNEILNPAEILVSIDKLAGEGFQFKLSYSGMLRAYTATMIDQRQGSRTVGYALSAADDSGLKALGMLLYKFLVVLDGDIEQLLDAERPARRG